MVEEYLEWINNAQKYTDKKQGKKPERIALLALKVLRNMGIDPLFKYRSLKINIKQILSISIQNLAQSSTYVYIFIVRISVRRTEWA